MDTHHRPITLPRLSCLGEPANDNDPATPEPRQRRTYPLRRELHDGRIGRDSDEALDMALTVAWIEGLLETASVDYARTPESVVEVADAHLRLKRVKHQLGAVGFEHLRMAVEDRASMTAIADTEGERGEGSAKAGRAFLVAALRGATKVRLDIETWEARENQPGDVNPLGPAALFDMPARWLEAANDDMRREWRRGAA